MTRLATSMRRSLAASVVLFTSYAWMPAARADTQYTIVELGVGSSAAAFAVNAGGEVAGVVSISTGFHYDNVVLTPLPGLREWPSTYGRGINAAGVVAGNCRSLTIPPFPVVLPSIWTNGELMVINNGGLQGGEAYDISDSGLVVGWSDAFGTERAFLWDGVDFVDLGTLDENPAGGYFGKSHARGINNNNQIVGDAATNDFPGFTGTAFLYTTGQGMQGLGPYMGGATTANDLNDAAAVIGTTDLPTGSRVGFRWQDGEFIDLGHLGGEWVMPNGINNKDQIVGTSKLTPASGALHAFIWQRGEMTDLNTLIDPGSGWTLGVAYDINDSGQIAAMGSIGDEQTQRAVRLDPIPPPMLGDINGDGSVNGADITFLLASWGPCAGCPADLNGDGTVDGIDITFLLANWTG